MSSDLSDKTCRIRPTTKPTVAVIGASPDPDKPSHKAVIAFRESGFAVFPVNPNATEVAGEKCYDSVLNLPVSTLDRVALYVPATVGIATLNDLAQLAIGEIWVAPGADDPAVIQAAKRMGYAVYTLCPLDHLGVAH
jgi:predicted CoA-binding protein